VEWPGMSRRGASGAHASTGCVGNEGREGSEGMGVNEQASKQASKRGREQPPSRQRAECHGGERVVRHMHAASNPHTLFFASLNEESKSVAVEYLLLFDEYAKSCQGHSIFSSVPNLLSQTLMKVCKNLVTTNTDVVHTYAEEAAELHVSHYLRKLGRMCMQRNAPTCPLPTATLQEPAFHCSQCCKSELHILHILNISHIVHIAQNQNLKPGLTGVTAAVRLGLR
jgi:hypothetical protein